MNSAPIRTKKRKIQSKQFKNFSPVCFQSNIIAWDAREICLIHWIAKRYSFNPSFDLPEHLSRFDAEVETLKELDRQAPTVTESLEFLKEFKKKIVKVEKIIKKLKKTLTNQDIDEISHLLELLFRAGTHIRENIADNTSGSYALIHKTEDRLELLNNADLFISLHINLLNLLAGADGAIENLPPAKRGRKSTNLEKGIIHKLLYIYIEGTSNKKASCNFHPEHDRYYGDFYYFILIVISLLRRKIQIKTLKKETWGDYAREVIRYHYRKKKQPAQ